MELKAILTPNGHNHFPSKNGHNGLGDLVSGESYYLVKFISNEIGSFSEIEVWDDVPYSFETDDDEYTTLAGRKLSMGWQTATIGDSGKSVQFSK